MFFDFLPSSGYICAHRGVRSLAPENTLLAAKKVVGCGADFWELDVHKVADGTLMVFHDEVLTRTTDVARRPEFAGRKPWGIHSFSSGELQGLDAGTWFLETDPFKTIETGEVVKAEFDLIGEQRIMTLAEALVFTRQKNLPMNLEIKNQLNSPGDLSIVGDVLDLLRETKTEDLVLVSSFNHDYLVEMRRLHPSLPLAALAKGKNQDKLVKYLKDLDVQAYHPSQNIVDIELVSLLSAEGIRVTPYTVNDMDHAVSLIDAGAFAVITDFPCSLRQRLQKPF